MFENWEGRKWKISPAELILNSFVEENENICVCYDEKDAIAVHIAEEMNDLLVGRVHTANSTHLDTNTIIIALDFGYEINGVRKSLHNVLNLQKKTHESLENPVRILFVSPFLSEETEEELFGRMSSEQRELVKVTWHSLLSDFRRGYCVRNWL